MKKKAKLPFADITIENTNNENPAVKRKNYLSLPEVRKVTTHMINKVIVFPQYPKDII